MLPFKEQMLTPLLQLMPSSCLDSFPITVLNSLSIGFPDRLLVIHPLIIWIAFPTVLHTGLNLRCSYYFSLAYPGGSFLDSSPNGSNESSMNSQLKSCSKMSLHSPAVCLNLWALLHAEDTTIVGNRVKVDSKFKKGSWVPSLCFFSLSDIRSSLQILSLPWNLLNKI